VAAAIAPEAKMQFYVVADQDTVEGFRYAGVRGTVAETPRRVARELDRLAESEEDLIIITTEQTANQVREKVNAIRYGEAQPLIVEIPGPQGPSPESPSLLKMIREAVGIKV
jgi:V/A-type H+-transporting ATPase subunit F